MIYLLLRDADAIERPPKKTKGSSSLKEEEKTRWARAFQGVNLPPSKRKEGRPGSLLLLHLPHVQQQETPCVLDIYKQISPWCV